MKLSEIHSLMNTSKVTKDSLEKAHEGHRRVLVNDRPGSRLSKVILSVTIFADDSSRPARIEAHAGGEWAHAMHLTPTQLRRLAEAIEWFDQWVLGEHDDPLPDVDWLRPFQELPVSGEIAVE